MQSNGLDLVTTQFRELLKNPIPKVSVERKKTQPGKIIFGICGPWNSAFEDYLLEVTFLYDSNYPTDKPKIKFTYDILHPNVSFNSSPGSTSDSVCCALFNNWNTYSVQEKTISQQVLAIIAMLLDPGFGNPYAKFTSEQLNLFKTNPAEYKKYIQNNLKGYKKI